MNQELQKDYNLLGEDNFTFEVLDTLKPKKDKDYNYSEDLKVLEEMRINELLLNEKNCYNTMKPR